MKAIKEIKKMKFQEAYDYLEEKDMGDWDNINSEEIIKQYCKEMIDAGVHISHILDAIEQNQSSEELYYIWLGNSMETPTPINNVSDLLEALGLNNDE
jgi:hypothetical protein